ncbi:hypothetical protein B0H11DRAFT_2236488 [Mycena galericulata]|nr:hypothetical protein B0H11DRAFT_2236488 [Mycena galericulata]
MPAAKPKKTAYAAAKKAASGKKKAAGPAAAESDYEEPAPPKSRKPRVVDPRSPLPERSTRGINPARGIKAGDPNPAKPRPKRTSAEVQAAEKRQQEEDAQWAALEVKKYETLARMEIEEEEEDEEDEEYSIKDIADLHRMPTYLADVPDDFAGRAALSDYDDEDYLGRYAAMDDAALEELSGGGPAARASPEIKVPPPKPRKKAKGQTREEIDIYKAQMKGGSKRAGDWDGNPEAKRPKLKPLFAVGLDNDWRTKVGSSKAVGGSKGAASVVNQKKAKGDTSTIPLGGFTDEDAAAQGPVKTGKAKAKVSFQSFKKELDLKRRNDDVVVVSSDEENDAPAFKGRKTPHPKVQVKTEGPKTAPTQVAASSSFTVADASSPTPQAAIPPFINGLWRSHLIPTLNARLGSSHKPWEEGDLQSIQDVFNVVYPGYKLTISSQVFTKARDRVYDRRTWFGGQATEIVFSFFQEDQFTDAKDPHVAIAAYANYALRPDGPMLWKEPAPENLAPTDDGYTKPGGLFESLFMISLMSSFVKHIGGSSKNYGHLYGAIGLAAAALERAFSMFTTGELVVNETQFSRENVSDIVNDYISTAERLSDRRWDSIMEAYGASLKKKAAVMSVNASSMQSKRRDLYVPSSP